MASDQRCEGRSNVFLTATLSGGVRPAAVRIRNISAKGALVEGADLPAVGSRIRLVRGSLSVAGHLAWEGASHAGLTFDSEIVVTDWVRRLGHSGQQRVDQIFAALRTARNAPGDLDSEQEAASLVAISAALTAICERLASHPAIGVELGEELIKLDTIAEVLRKLAARAG